MELLLAHAPSKKLPPSQRTKCFFLPPLSHRSGQRGVLQCRMHSEATPRVFRPSEPYNPLFVSGGRNTLGVEFGCIQTQHTTLPGPMGQRAAEKTKTLNQLSQFRANTQISVLPPEFRISILLSPSTGRHPSKNHQPSDTPSP